MGVFDITTSDEGRLRMFSEKPLQQGYKKLKEMETEAESYEHTGIAGNALRSALAGFLGAPGDYQDLMSAIVSSLPVETQLAIKLAGVYERIVDLPNYEDMAKVVGADPSRPSGIAGMVGAPDPSDVGRYGPALAMTLFHGTPHKFSKFELEKIGTGEGAQAYGHGLYFAESPGVAKSYQANLSRGLPTSVEVRGKRSKLFSEMGDAASDVDADEFLAEWARINGGEPPFSFDKNARAENAISEFRRRFPDASFDDEDRIFDALEGLSSNDFKVLDKGHLYEVDIPDETIDKMLDWDAPLSEQLDVIGDLKLPVDNELTGATAREVNLIFDNAIRQAKAGDSGVTGETLYELMSRSVGERRASAMLNEAGIPGIRYFDAQSRQSVDMFINGKPRTALGVAQMARKDLGEPAGSLVSRYVGQITITGGNPEAALLSEAAYHNATKADIDAARNWIARHKIENAPRTRNIVLFDPDTITEVKRDGELVFKK